MPLQCYSTRDEAIRDIFKYIEILHIGDGLVPLLATIRRVISERIRLLLN